MTIDLYIWEQKEPTKSILDYLHHLMLHLAPDIEHTLKWKVPYYSSHKAILYINPIKKKKGGVEICFARARKFEKGQELLDFKDRKTVGGYTVLSLEEINEDAINMLILEAVRVDELYAGTNPWTGAI